MTAHRRAGAIRLREIELREIRLPLVEPFRTAAGVVEARRVLLLQLTNADGTVAWSECVAEERPGYSPDTVDTCWLAIAEWLAPRALDASFADPEAAHDVLAQGVRGHRMARAAIEMGIWALAAAREDCSLAALLARSAAVAREGERAPRTHVESGIALGMKDSPAQLAAAAHKALASGYCRLRVKIAPGRDVAELAALRAALGPDVSISADANGSYEMTDPAHLAALDSLDALGLAMLEQPLAYDDLLRHAALQRRLATPVCLDESLTSAARVEDMLALGSGRVVNLKAGRVGGLREALAIHDCCLRANVPLWCGGMLESGIGRAYNVALASLPGFTEPGDLAPSARYWARDVVTPEWTMDGDGRVRVPLDRAGLGVAVDTAFVDDLTVRALVRRAP